MSDVKVEMSKVTWPTMDELKSSTWVVIVFSLAISAYIFLVDQGLTQLLKLIY
ncbi:MAG: preprotein translocase subunit SecE [candidate division KSB1 bacterium]|nr:preprotein translocase subunit SecE [candidate division KSB1 bacterium]MDQ7063797.1 preprotein translocase subunit SecE [candidate division KSB1 bacterium]